MIDGGLAIFIFCSRLFAIFCVPGSTMLYLEKQQNGNNLADPLFLGREAARVKHPPGRKTDTLG